MDSCIDIQPNLSHIICTLNPQCEQQRCRICYQQTKPLITLCECSGTIAYVHEGCILDWITKKMQNSQTVQIPKCQICKTTYSARLKVGRKKICPKILLRKLKEQKIMNIVYLLFYLIGSILAVITASKTVFSLVGSLLTYNTQGNTANELFYETSGREQGVVMRMFKSIVFPAFFVKAAIIYGKKQLKILQDSKVQIVEVTLNPKTIIKPQIL